MKPGRILLPLLILTQLSGCALFSKKDEQLARDHASCALLQALTDTKPSEPLYQRGFFSCSKVEELDEAPFFTPSYYADAECTQPVDYKALSFFDFCRNNLLSPTNQTYIGNAAAWPNEGSDNDTLGKHSKWTLGYGPTLDILALSPKDNHRPFLQQVEYREVNGCHLEMRVYRESLRQQNLKPLLLIHGGAWKYRGFGAIGGEALVSQLTERGFIVFEPYYRLMGNADGPQECRIPAPVDNVAPGELIVSDIEAALQWVNEHGAALGAEPGSRVSLVGQSAGAHLAQWLAAHRGNEIDKVLVFYTPADIKNYVEELGHTYPWNHEGRQLIGQFLGVPDLATIQSNPPPFVSENSFPELVRSGVDHPPLFMIHGNADELVPVEMSIRMCEALSEPATPQHDMHTGGRYQCGSRRGVDNILYVVDGANHILDLRCVVDPAITALLGDKFTELSKLCPSGSKRTTEEVVRPAMLEGIKWLL
ncbi:MAG TPA: alpha/beta hydrolase [Gammaproteobacteria bacterium]